MTELTTAIEATANLPALITILVTIAVVFSFGTVFGLWFNSTIRR